MKHFLLFYEAGPHYLERRPDLPGQHSKRPWASVWPVCPEDWGSMFAAASDPLIWAGHPASDRYTEPRFRAFFDGAIASGGALTFVDRATGEIIGCSRYHDHDAERRRVEIGYTFLVRSRWGGVYNGEVKRLMLDHALRYVDTVQFGIAQSNIRSQRAIAKIGATLAGREMRDTSGEAIPYLIYEVTRPR